MGQDLRQPVANVCRCTAPRRLLSFPRRGKRGAAARELHLPNRLRGWQRTRRLARRERNQGTRMNAKSDLIHTLNELIECCKDGEYGFRASAEQVKTEALRSALLARADECRLAADQLRPHVAQLGGKPEDGSMTGALHRGWVAMRTKLTTYDDLAVLDECERGEDSALGSYRDALEQELPAPLRSLIERQYAGVQRNHDQIKQLRDALRTTVRQGAAS
jgi:uncharacterized protein (TIGR02284 family)